MRTAGIALLMLTAACAKPSPDICSDYPPRLPTKGDTPDGIRQNAEACVQHWSARLAQGPDPVDEVVGAAMGACREGIEDAEMDQDASARNGFEYRLRDLASFRVVQTRAGHCGIPDLGKNPL